ncbi:MAG: aminopeptidase P N-terminal domain-containing protein [Candidatus Sericytochromatia bacterium]|nr:aminopeptidase P N-terminal domain-containing protein [Candidatus Sericytochromatia bacterium]
MPAAEPSLYARRRANFMKEMKNGAALFFNAPPRIRSRDTDHRYRPDSDFFYLTGFREAGSALLLLPGHPEHQSVLFVQPRNPELETWHGRRLGVEAAPAALQVDQAYSFDDLEQVLQKYLTGVPTLYFQLGTWREHDEIVLRLLPRLGNRHVHPPETLVSPGAIVHEMRLRKDASEIALMKRAAEVTAVGYQEALAHIRPGGWEYEVQAALEFAYRRLGGEGSAYTPIVAAGDNATILHYNENDQPLQDGQLLLIDSGAEFGYYACDVSRTYPVGGRFSQAQRAVYELVLKAQTEAIAWVRVGEHVKAYHEHAVRVLTAGMVELGWLTGDLEELIQREAYKRFYMHGTGHYLGLDTHDVGPYRLEEDWRPIEPGMVFTVEPGLYVPHGMPGIDPAFWGIGVRIEDDIWVDQAGCPHNLTAAIPKSVDEVEGALQGTRSGVLQATN